MAAATPPKPSKPTRKAASPKPAGAGRGPRAETSAAGAQDYTAAQLMVLEGLEAVRKRPGMYIGSTDGRGLMHCLWEIVDNSVDEALAGVCTRIVVTLHPDGSVEVEDNGRGIPVDVEKRTKLSGVEVVFTKLHAGGKFGGGSYTASGGLHGVGASVVNALSSRLDVRVTRGGKVHEATFRRGVNGVFDAEGPDAGFTKSAGLRVVGKAKPAVSGTTVRWWADRQIFIADAQVELDALEARLRQTSFLVPGLELVLRDQRAGSGHEVTFLHKGGISEYCDFLAKDEPVSSVIRLIGHGQFTETVPVLDAAGHMSPTEVKRDVDVDIAMRWGNGYDTDVRSYVNIIATGKGGTHVSGFERALTKTVNEILRSTRTLRANEDAVTKEDITEGLTAVVTVRFAEPQFEGQTKEVLGTPGITRIVSSVVAKELAHWFTSPPRGEKAAAKAVLDKVANAARARLAARQSRDLQRRKTALGSSALPAKLRDCQTDDVARSELFIVEGDSALGTAKDARYSDYQALLPIRGKILNVQKSSVADMLKNAECASIIQVLGAGTGRECDPSTARYGKIILMSDADVDGAHIRCLLLTLIHRHMRPLLESGMVYAAVPPLHRIEMSGSGGRKPEVRYTYSDAELQRVLSELKAQGRGWKDPIQRYKGLGEMDARQLRETTMDPASRTLRRIQVSDAEQAATVFDLLMGSDVPPRREFIITGAQEVDRAKIDV
ncbi:MAG: type IIA DNA topoisomerase subunit B [Actinobacteria bacterium]|nr:type IIA DNA topoisomerase subunit B [Actinomycetota bacterium]